MGPYIFYRVEDEHSRARYSDGHGILAEDQGTAVNFRRKGDYLFDQIAQHLDWSNRVPTSFISTYCDEDVAWREARRRAKAGKRHVGVYTINMREGVPDERVEYRDLRRLAGDLGLYIPDNAWNNSEYEYIFVRCIPDSVVVHWEDV